VYWPGHNPSVCAEVNGKATNPCDPLFHVGENVKLGDSNALPGHTAPYKGSVPANTPIAGVPSGFNACWTVVAATPCTMVIGNPIESSP
jgi:hypothetical protein